MKKKIAIIFTVLMLFAFSIAVYAYTSTNYETSCCANCCKDKDSCPMKKDSKDSCCSTDCCKDGKCTMDCCKDKDSCPMKSKENKEGEMKDCPMHNKEKEKPKDN